MERQDKAMAESWVEAADRAVLEYLAVRPLLTSRPLLVGRPNLQQQPASVSAFAAAQSVLALGAAREASDTADPGQLATNTKAPLSANIPTSRDDVVLPLPSQRQTAAPAALRKGPVGCVLPSLFQRKRNIDVFQAINEYRSVEAARAKAVEARIDCADELGDNNEQDDKTKALTKTADRKTSPQAQSCTETMKKNGSSSIPGVASALPAMAQPEAIYKPKLTDILCGRGRHLLDHPGNVAFRNIITAKMDGYESSRKLGKHWLSVQVVNEVKEANGRFLKPLVKRGKGRASVQCWQEMDHDEARLKVASAFRSLRKSVKNQQEG